MDCKPGFISTVWYTNDRWYAFQRVGQWYRLYDHDGAFIKEFRSMMEMENWIREHDREEAD